MFREDIKNKFFALLASEYKLTDDVIKNLKEAVSFGDLERRIVAQKISDAESVARLKAGFFRIPYVNLVGEEIDPDTLNMVPRELAENYQVIAYAFDGSVLSVGIVEPDDLKVREVIEFLAREKQIKLQFVAISYESFKEGIKQYTALESEVEEYLGDAEASFKDLKSATANALGGDESVSSAPIAKMVSVILKHAVEEHASDIHIEPVLNQTRVRYRIDGILKTSLVLPNYVHSAIVSRIKVMARLKIDETRIPQDGRIRIQVAKRNIDFRVSTLPLYRNEKIVMRILDSSGDDLTLEELGFEGRNLEVINKNIKKPNGMFLVTGPTGSGKTTTLYAVLHELNKEEVNIVTLEDPVEYFRKGINQSQINPDVGLTFASGLRSILRQDPDIIMVGEIRDKETGDLAVHAALTGHFMLSTLHTNDAFGTIPRLVDLGVEAFLLASTLNVIVAQRLVRKLCVRCKEETTVPDNVLEEVKSELDAIPKHVFPDDIDKQKLVFYRGKGCQHCNNVGYRGRSAVAEVLEMTDDLKELISTKNDWNEVKKVFIKQGMVSIKQDGIIKALRGITSMEEVLRVTKDN